VHGKIDRRGFLDRAQKFATVGMSADAILAALSPNFALGQQVPKDDKRIKTQWIEVPSPQGNGMVKGYQHGFNNDTTPRYDAGSARVAWEKTVVFFKDTLTGVKPRSA